RVEPAGRGELLPRDDASDVQASARLLRPRGRSDALGPRSNGARRRAPVMRAAGRPGAGAPASEASKVEGRAAGRPGAGAPASEASNLEGRAAGRPGAGAPASEASNLEGRAGGRPGAGAPGVRGEQSRRPSR